MNRITVFCGSSLGSEAIFKTTAVQLGQKLAKEGIGMVYGGANVGLMGAIADGVLGMNGEVIGVIPEFLQSKEIAHQGLTQLIVVDSMHDRKKKMNDLCDGVIALPGGFGTLEELFEMLTWGQLGFHVKPIGILNMNGFYDELIALINTMVDKGFLKKVNQEMILISDDIDDLLDKMNQYKGKEVKKWINEDKI